jgi:hypothetical protein
MRQRSSVLTSISGSVVTAMWLQMPPEGVAAANSTATTGRQTRAAMRSENRDRTGVRRRGGAPASVAAVARDMRMVLDPVRIPPSRPLATGGGDVANCSQRI